MAFVHCHNCDWSQDDFYSPDGYNPAKYLMSWMDTLCGGDIDEQFSDDAEFLRRNGPISTREVIAREFESYAGSIRSMEWVTWEEFRADETPVCPGCGSSKLDID